MAAWKVGMRVRIARRADGPLGPQRYGIGSPIGKTATIIGIPALLHGYDCSIMVDDYPMIGCSKDVGYAAMFAALEPLLPPDDAADQFIARIKKLATEPINDAPKVTAREGK